MEGSIVLVLFGSFLALLLLGAPITVALGVSSLISYLYLGENPIKLVQIAFTSVGSFPLMALPDRHNSRYCLGNYAYSLLLCD